jgi:hypothetical protein
MKVMKSASKMNEPEKPQQQHHPFLIDFTSFYRIRTPASRSPRTSSV